MPTVIIKPKSGSKKFYKNAKQFQRVVDPSTKQATGEFVAAGEYAGERFPNSLQKPRIRFSFSKRRWLMYEDNKAELDGEKLNALVKACHFVHMKGSLKDQYITQADVTNLKDPFFNHPELHLRLKEGSAVLNTDEAGLDKLMASGLRANRQFKQAGADGNAMGAANVKYIITDKETDLKATSGDRDKTIEAVKLFEALNDRQRGIIARIMGLGVRTDTDRALVDDVLFKAAMDRKTTAGDTNITKQEMFFKLCKMDSEKLAFRDLLARSRQLNIIRKNKEGYNFRGQRIGRTSQAVESFFEDFENQEMLISLEQALEDQQKE